RRACRRAHACRPRRQLAFLGDVKYPSPPWHAAFAPPPLFVAKGYVPRHEERSVWRDNRTERVFVVVSGQWPCVDGFVDIRLPVVVRIDQLGQFTALSAIKGAVFIRQTENLVQSQIGRA